MCVPPRLLDALVTQQTAHLQARIEILTARLMQNDAPQADPTPTTTTTPPAPPAAATQPLPPITQGAAPEPLSAEELAELVELIAANREFIRVHGCLHCGGLHVRACPRIKSQVLRGPEVTEVEFWPPGTWEHLVYFPDTTTATAPASPVTEPSGTPAIPPPPAAPAPTPSS